MGIGNNRNKQYQYLTHQTVACLVGLLLLFFSTSMLSAQNITIEGMVNLEPAGLRSAGSVGNGYGSSSGSASAESQNSANSIIIWLESSSSNGSAQAKKDSIRVLNQKGQQFQPRLMAVRQGSIVRIKNSDPVYHNVFSLSKAKKFDVGRRSPKDPPLDKRFDKAGIVDVFCDIHSDMHAVIVVLPEQTVTWQKLDRAGAFELSNIVPGTYTLHFYAMGDRSRTVHINAEKGKNVNLGSIQLGS